MGSALGSETTDQAAPERLDAGEVSRNGILRKGKARRAPEPQRAIPWEETSQAWLTYVQGHNKPTTYKDYRSRLGIVRAWAMQHDITLDQFRARQLDQFLAWRQEAGLADSSRRHDAIVVKAFLKWAFLRKFIRSNPMYGYEIPKAVSPPRHAPPPDEISRLIQAVEDCWNIHKTPEARYTYEPARRFYAARDVAIIIGLIASGARISEMLSLRVEDWRPDLNQIAFQNTKGATSRTLPVSALWVPYVEAYLKLRPQCENPYLFVNADGGSYDKQGHFRPMPQTTWARAWKRYMTRAGLSGWSCHNLRHYAGTHIAVDKSNLMLANALLGHKDLKTTKIYVHNSAQAMQQAYADADPLKSIPILVNKRNAKRPKLL